MSVCLSADEFINTVMKERAQAEAQENERKRAAMEIVINPLLPLLKTLEHFHSLAMLDARLSEIYDFLDCDQNGALSKSELNAGLRRLRLEPPIHLSDDDWLNLTERESLCNEDGELDKTCFVLVVKEQLKQHMLSELVNSMAVADPVQAAMLSVLKLILSQTDPTTEPPAHSVQRLQAQRQLLAARTDSFLHSPDQTTPVPPARGGMDASNQNEQLQKIVDMLEAQGSELRMLQHEVADLR